MACRCRHSAWAGAHCRHNMSSQSHKVPRVVLGCFTKKKPGSPTPGSKKEIYCNCSVNAQPQSTTSAAPGIQDTDTDRKVGHRLQRCDLMSVCCPVGRTAKQNRGGHVFPREDRKGTDKSIDCISQANLPWSAHSTSACLCAYMPTHAVTSPCTQHTQ